MADEQYRWLVLLVEWENIESWDLGMSFKKRLKYVDSSTEPWRNPASMW